jgi:hypothetical protein
VANEVVKRQFPHYRNMMKDDVHVRITGVVIIDDLRSLRQVRVHRRPIHVALDCISN